MNYGGTNPHLNCSQYYSEVVQPNVVAILKGDGMLARLSESLRFLDDKIINLEADIAIVEILGTGVHPEKHLLEHYKTARATIEGYEQLMKNGDNAKMLEKVTN